MGGRGGFCASLAGRLRAILGRQCATRTEQNSRRRIFLRRGRHPPFITAPVADSQRSLDPLFNMSARADSQRWRSRFYQRCALFDKTDRPPDLTPFPAWRRSAGVALVGFGSRAVAACRRWPIRYELCCVSRPAGMSQPPTSTTQSNVPEDPIAVMASAIEPEWSDTVISARLWGTTLVHRSDPGGP